MGFSSLGVMANFDADAASGGAEAVRTADGTRERSETDV